MTAPYLVSTDLDGTLLDHHDYSFAAALPGLERCSELGIPVIINTSKTYAEVITLQNSIGLEAPLIVENGSALIAKEAQWRFTQERLSIECTQRGDGARQIVFGAPRQRILDFIQAVRIKHQWQFQGFNDWSITEIAQQTGLDLESAERASRKEFSEPFVWLDSEAALTDFIGLASEHGLKVLQGGRFYHLQGDTDKAKPLAWLKEFGSAMLKTMPIGNCSPNLICLGDSNNDVAMLNAADYPVCVRSPVADFPDVSSLNKVYYTQGFGPVGWSEAMLSILSKLA